MPLVHGKSQKSFVKNIKTELAHGRPHKQALAIAYSIKRKAAHKAHGGKIEEVIHDEGKPSHEDIMTYGEPHMKRAHMAKGGHVNPYSASLKDPKFHEKEMASGYVGHEDVHEKHNLAAEHEEAKKLNQHLAYGGKVSHAHHAHGGKVHHSSHMAHGGHAHAHHMEHHAHGDIVGRILRKHYSHGGVLANAGDALAEHQADQHVREYDYLVANDDLESTQQDFGDELGNEREEHDRHDIVSKIIQSMKKKDRMPRV